MSICIKLILFFLLSFSFQLGFGQDRVAGSSKSGLLRDLGSCEGLVVVPLDEHLVHASTLIETILGKGIESYDITHIQSIASGTMSKFPDDASAGLFSGGEAAGIGLEKGIILSSGFIGNAVGVNSSDRISGILNLDGDDDLNTLQSKPTFDATVLEFSFMTYLDEIIIKFVFGSDEYTQYVGGTTNDVFAFFLNGTNIALVPETNQAISINTINPLKNSHLYIDNEYYEDDTEWPKHCNEMDGFTTVLTVSGPVNPGVMNTIKLAIADVGDRIIDSWVFISEGGLSGHAPELSISKVAEFGFFHKVGDEIIYTIQVKNTGNITINDIEVLDALTDDSHFFESIRPGAVVTFTTTYVVSQADMDRGSIENHVVVTGLDHEDQEVVAEDTETIYVDPEFLNPQITLEKTANTAHFNALGQSITYTITLTNTGNLTLFNIGVNDELTDELWLLEDLPPGDSHILTTTYSITKEDIIATVVENTAIVSATDPQGSVLFDSQTALITLSGTFDLAIAKSVSEHICLQPGDTITFSINVSNQGSLPVTNVVIQDTISNSTVFIAADQNGEFSYDTGSIVWVVNELLSGEHMVFELTVQVKEEAEHGQEITNTAAIYTDQTESQVSNSVELFVQHPPTVEQAHLADVKCFGEANGSVQLDIEGGSPPYQFQWSTSDTTQNLMNLHSGIYTIIITDINGCTTTEEVTITQPEELLLQNLSITGVDYIMDLTGMITFDTQGGTPPYNYLWSSGDTTAFLTGVPGGDYLLTIADANGCVFEHDFFIPYQTELCEIAIPGAITPNDDGYNDLLFIKCLANYPNNSLKIFNRYGTQIFHASPYQNDWDGKPNRGNILTEPDGRVPAGTYFYLLTVDQGPGPFSGYLYLVK